MAKNKLMLNNEWRELFNGLPDEKAGQLIKAAFACHDGGEVDLDDPVLSAVFAMMAAVITENREAYIRKCEANETNGKKGGRPKTEVAEEKPKETQKNRTVLEKTETNPTKAKKANRKEKNRREENRKDKKDILSGKPDDPPLMTAVGEIIDYLNAKAGTNYQRYNRSAAELIRGRMAEKHTVEDFKTVIDKKTAEWKDDPDMCGYLRPSTLFAKAHFEEYLNQPQNPRKTAFHNFPARSDPESRNLVQQLIAAQR